MKTINELTSSAGAARSAEAVAWRRGGFPSLRSLRSFAANSYEAPGQGQSLERADRIAEMVPAKPGPQELF